MKSKMLHAMGGMAVLTAAVTAAAPAQAQSRYDAAYGYDQVRPDERRYEDRRYEDRRYEDRRAGQYRNDRSEMNALLGSINQLRDQIRQNARTGRLSRGEAMSLDRQAVSLRQRAYAASRNGLRTDEFNRIKSGIHNLRYRLTRETRDGDRWRDDARRRY